MKKLMLFLVLLTNFALTNFVVSQTLPTAVDNSKWFPPVRSQQVLPNCTQFSLIYYLKSAIWNQHFNRDPKLEVNQFNHNFVWNQTADPIYGKSDAEGGFYFMKNQGCASMSDFPANEQSFTIQPSQSAKVKALSFKSKKLFQLEFNSCMMQADKVTAKLQSLKDSLVFGKCFTINIMIFDSFFKMSDSHNIYSCYGEVGMDSIRPNHVVTVMGYDDAIKTAKGYGAFKVIDSDTKIPSGIFYLDYNWLYFTQSDYTCHFLEEDFSSSPQIIANIQLSGNVSGQDVSEYKSCFVDTILSNGDKKVDFVNFIDYLYGTNQSQLIKINNNRLNMRSKTIIRPLNNLDGSYELVSDLSDLSSIANFKSAAIIVFDPISVNYVGANNQSFYSYVRESKLKVENAYISLAGTDKKIIAKVNDLADTTIVVNDFYSVVAGLNLIPFQEQIYVKSCTSILKRKLITFSIADLQANTPPVFTQVPSSSLIVGQNEIFSFTFKALDADNNPLTYSIANGVGASINPTTGLFQYQASQAGTFSFTVKVSDGVTAVSTTFEVKVNGAQINEAPIFYSRAESGFSVLQGDLIVYQMAANDPEGVAITYSIVSGTGATLNSTTGMFSYPSLNVGTFIFKVRASDGVNNVDSEFNIIVAKNNLPTFTGLPDMPTLQLNDTFNYRFLATDPEGKPIKFSVTGDLGAHIDESTGEFSYKATTPGSFNFQIVISDWFNLVTFNLTIKVEGTNNAPVFVDTTKDLEVYVNNILTHQFTAVDKENDPITFSISNPLPEAQLSSDGKLTFKAGKVGMYYFTVVASDGHNSADLAASVKVDFDTDVETISAPEFSASIYPNPVVNNMNIKIFMKDSGPVNMLIYDMQGRQLVNTVSNCEVGQSIIDYDASNLRSGNYVCKFTVGAKFSATVKIIKK